MKAPSISLNLKSIKFFNMMESKMIQLLIDWKTNCLGQPIIEHMMIIML